MFRYYLMMLYLYTNQSSNFLFFEAIIEPEILRIVNNTKKYKIMGK